MPELLDLPLWIGQRAESFEFRLYDAVSGLVRGQLHPVRDATPTLEHDATATISRRINGLVLGVADAALIDPISDRVDVAMVTGDGVSYPLGRYRFADDTRATYSQGDLRRVTLYDDMFTVDQEIETAFDVVGMPADQAIITLLDGLPIGPVAIDATDQVVTNSWSAGTTRGSVLTELATLGGYFQPWFNHTGQLRVMRAFEPAAQLPDVDLDDPPRVYRESITRTSDLLTAPNRFVVISNDDSGESDGAAPVVGTYDVPSTAPYSIAQRGFVIPQVLDVQVTDAVQAAAYARAVGIQQTVYERVELDTPADPRHDGFTVVKFDGVLWLEIGWSMTLVPGGSMRHTLRRAYPQTGEFEA